MNNINNRPLPNRSGRVLLGIVVLLYAVAAAIDSSSAVEAFKSSFKVLQGMLPVLLVVVVLMALINSFIQPKKLARLLGKKSGFRGWGIALFGGLFSHGSGYIWYPMLSDLRRHGVKDGLIVTFFYARAVKLPWMPMMIAYFGTGFTIILTFYILLGALIQGFLADFLLNILKRYRRK